MVGTNTVALIGSYATMELLVAAWTGLSTTATSPQDTFQVFIEPGIGGERFHLVKVEVD